MNDQPCEAMDRHVTYPEIQGGHVTSGGVWPATTFNPIIGSGGQRCLRRPYPPRSSASLPSRRQVVAVLPLGLW